MSFSWTEKDLNFEQSNAVLEPISSLVIACPGSGKTKTLTRKIAYELSRLTSSRQFIVAITYTHRAADEIHERIEDLGVDTSQLWIGTIHSFCLEWIIKPYAIYQPELSKGFKVIDLHDKEKLLEELCKPYSSQRVTFWDCEYYFGPTGYSLGCSDTSKHPAIHKVLTEYFNRLSANRQIDFELILWLSLKLIESLPRISKLLSKLFPLILVDEYQDTKEIQYNIIASILRTGQESSRLFMVGDPNQAIYTSLGGYPIAIQDLAKLTTLTIKTLSLSANYRSSKRVIDYFGNFSVNNSIITAEGEYRDYASRITYNDQINRDQLINEIAKVVRYSVETLGISPKEICILAPQWVHLAVMTRGLIAQMPDYHFDGPGIVPIARDIDNFWYKLSRIALTEPSPQLFIRRMRWAREVLHDLADAGVDASRLDPRQLLRQCNSLSIQENDGLTYLKVFFDNLFSALNIPFHMFDSLEQQYQAFIASAESRIERILKEGVNQIRDLSFFKKAFTGRSGITVSTIHGVKGSEFDIVIAYALLEGMVPHFNDQLGDISASRLLYVVGSRARKNLHLFSETGRSRGKYGDYLPTKKLKSCNFTYD
ncbi:MAG TPA: ATP-dependent helicase [Cellvibrio sp.]|nr:ATP-dependent helicase [Cellvibrio sp.]